MQLGIVDNDLGDDGGRQIAEGMLACALVSDLNLRSESSTHPDPSSCIFILHDTVTTLEYIAYNCRLKNYEGFPFGTLSDNKIGIAGAKYIAEGLIACPRMITLEL